MLAMQREQRALLELQRFERIAALERRIFEHAFAAFDQVEQQLGRPVEVQALLPSSAAAPVAAQPGRKGQSGAITGEFQKLAPFDASQSTGSEDASNGNGKRPFRRGR